MGNQVLGNYIGTDLYGRAGLGYHNNGIDVAGDNNTIGGSKTGARNLISGNGRDGVLIDSGATGNLVQGNYLGTNAAGTLALPNGTGLEILGPSNTVGGTAAGAGNLISGNGGDGVLINNGATGNQVQGNKIGTNAAGLTALANGSQGVDILDGSNNTIGGSAVGAGNLISGNTFEGILLESGATGNQVQGNIIGTDAGRRQRGQFERRGD
jgi:hypothetical protein